MGSIIPSLLQMHLAPPYSDVSYQMDGMICHSVVHFQHRWIEIGWIPPIRMLRVNEFLFMSSRLWSDGPPLNCNNETLCSMFSLNPRSYGKILSRAPLIARLHLDSRYVSQHHFSGVLHIRLSSSSAWSSVLLDQYRLVLGDRIDLRRHFMGCSPLSCSVFRCIRSALWPLVLIRSNFGCSLLFHSFEESVERLLLTSYLHMHLSWHSLNLISNHIDG